MKITIDIGLDDLLIKETESNDDFSCDNVTYRYADEDELRDIVKDKVREQIVHELGYNYGVFAQSLKEVITENKDEIITKVIKEVSSKILNQKAIKDFKKTLDN